MASQPFISVRKYIKWGDDPAGENTDTLVLTTAAKHYVDTRIYLPSNSSSSSTEPFSNPRLEWAFAGTCVSTPATSSKPAHTIWTHWVDSKTTEEVQDEGDMHPQPNGEVLEYGSMLNPTKGIVENYEECWVDLDPVVVGTEPGFRSWVLTTLEDGEARNEGGEERRVRTRGMIARVGQYTQGVLRKGDGVSIARWVWDATDDNEGAWRGDAGVGTFDSPIRILVPGPLMKLGDRFKTDTGLIWECVEAYEWA